MASFIYCRWMRFLQLSLIVAFFFPLLRLLFAASHESPPGLSHTGLDRGGDTDLLLAGSGVWCANRLFQLQQIHQQLLQVKGTWWGGGYRGENGGGGALWHPQSHVQHEQAYRNNLWSTLKPAASLAPRCANRQPSRQLELSHSLEITSVTREAFIPTFFLAF